MASWLARAARMKSRIMSTSLTPGARSTPEETSTPPARVMRTASATLPAVNPPDYARDTWWKNERGIIGFQNEVMKYLYYRLKY